MFLSFSRVCHRWLLLTAPVAAGNSLLMLWLGPPPGLLPAELGVRAVGSERATGPSGRMPAGRVTPALTPDCPDDKRGTSIERTEAFRGDCGLDDNQGEDQAPAEAERTRSSEPSLCTLGRSSPGGRLQAQSGAPGLTREEEAVRRCPVSSSLLHPGHQLSGQGSSPGEG